MCRRRHTAATASPQTENKEGCSASSTSTCLDDTAIAGAWWASDLAGTALIVAFVARSTDGEARSGEVR